MLREYSDETGELQSFAAQVEMAPAKIIGREFSRVEAVKALILKLWSKKLRKERDALGATDAQRRAQLTCDLQSLKNWDDGAAVIELELE